MNVQKTVEGMVPSEIGEKEGSKENSEKEEWMLECSDCEMERMGTSCVFGCEIINRWLSGKFSQ